MSSGEARRKVSRRELLRVREEKWRKRLTPQRVSLVAEDRETTSKHAEQALEVLGGLWMKESLKPSFLHRYPAVHVLATTRVATDYYAARFWPQLCEFAGIPADGSVQRAWGTAYLHNLQELGLPTFSDIEDAGTRYVGPILMHSGVPTYCLPDLFRLVTARRRKVPGLTPTDFVAWASMRVGLDGLRMVDKPVQRFLRYGGDFADDVTDRVFELLDVVAAGGDGSDVELPERFAHTAVELRESGTDLITSRGHESQTQPQTSASARAVLMLDPYGRGPFVRLPSIPDAEEGQVVWVVDAEGHEERVASLALLPGYREPTPQVDVPISRPVRQVSARLDGADLELSLSVIDASAPLLLFDEDGTQLSIDSPVRGSAVWALHAEEQAPMVQPSDDAIIAQGTLPPGWAGWRLSLVSLDEVSELGFGSIRRVRVASGAMPRIVMPTPVEGVRSLTGEPVFAEFPVVELPGLQGEDAQWSVSLVDDAGIVLVRGLVSGAEQLAGLWANAPRTLCGPVTLRVRGPWGRAATRHFTLVPGISLVADPQWRRMVRGGLTPCRVAITCAPHVRCSRSQLELSPTDTHAVITVATGPEKFPLVVEPPHMSVAHLTDARATSEVVTPLRLQADKLLEDPGLLVVRTGREAYPTLHAHGRSGHVQLIEPQRTTRDLTIHRFDLAQLTDTVRKEQHLKLTLDSEGEVVVGFVSPGRLFSDINIVDDEIVLTDAPQVEGLTVACYLAFAPWERPRTLPVHEGRAVLPEDMRHAGPLLVTVRVEDPWVPEPLPAWPEGHRKVFAPGSWTGGTEDETALSAFLAGDDTELAELRDLAPVWHAYDRLWTLGIGPRAQTVQQALRHRLRSDSSSALRALAGLTIDHERVPALLASSGIVALATAAPSASGSANVRRSNVLPLTLVGESMADDDALDALVGVCGEAVRDIAEGTDPHRRVGRMDAGSDALVQMPPSARSQVYRAAGVIPAGLLDENSRVLALEPVISNLDHPRLKWLRSNAERLTEELRTTFALIDYPRALEAMDDRHHPTQPRGWRAIPEWSIGMAFACRLSAHRQLPLPPVESGIRAMEDLATIAPAFVTIDVLIADLLVRAAATETPNAR